LSVNASANEAGSAPFVRQVAPWKKNFQGKPKRERDINMKAFEGLVVGLAVCALVGIGALGCNTVKGAGRSIEKGGQGIQNAAEGAQHGNGRHESRPHTITASAERSGSISPSGDTSVSRGSNRTFTIRANRGYHIADVLVDGKSVGARSRYRFDNVTANHTISALFTVNPSR
jgi:predicted small secreted protein